MLKSSSSSNSSELSTCSSSTIEGSAKNTVVGIELLAHHGRMGDPFRGTTDIGLAQDDAPHPGYVDRKRDVTPINAMIVSHRQTLQYYPISYLDILKSVSKRGGPIRVKLCYMICTATPPVFDVLCLQDR
jgi:hypothetical protein